MLITPVGAESKEQKTDVPQDDKADQTNTEQASQLSAADDAKTGKGFL